MKFKMEDVQIYVKLLSDTKNGKCWQWEQYRALHLPTNNCVYVWGIPHVKPEEKKIMIKRLKKKVEK